MGTSWGEPVMLNIKCEVKKLIKKYNTNNPYELCDYLHIKILFEELGSIKGFYQAVPKNKVIHLNLNLNDSDMLWTLAHELGHAILHTKLNILFLEQHTCIVKSKYEIEADTFAAELLIDDDLLKEYEGYPVNNIAKSENLDPKFLEYKFLSK